MYRSPSSSLFFLLPALYASALHGAEPPRPSIVYIFADDMGWGTGQFNNPASPVQTPNLNRLAESGVNFNGHYSATVCSPSRSMLMTGYHTGHGSNDRNSNIDDGLLPEETTVGEVLKSAGYATGVFGKWGWGGTAGKEGALRANPAIELAATLPQNKGFDAFYGYLNHRRAHSYRVDSLWTTEEPADKDKQRPNPDHGLWLEKTGNNASDPHAAYTHDLIGMKSEAYVRDHAGKEAPFYMQVNYTIPHFDLDAVAAVGPLVNLKGETIAPAGLGEYAGAEGMSDKERKHAAMVTRMDASIGSLIARLADPNGDGNKSDSVLENTVIFFSSDNGPTPENGLGKAGLINLDLTAGLRGGKRDLFEGGIRSPLLVRWDSGLKADLRGKTNATPTDLCDFIATAAELAGADAPTGIDGVSLASTLTGRGAPRPEKLILSENFEKSQTGNPIASWAIIRGDQKLIKFRDGEFRLYDLKADPTESNPLDLADPANAKQKEVLERAALFQGAGAPDDWYVKNPDWPGPDKQYLLPGDYNLDGAVDAADYTVWRDTLGQRVPPFTGADGNGDGVVNDADAQVWKQARKP